MSNWNINTTVDLAHISTDKRVDAGTVQFVYGDNAAHTWNVTVLEDGAPADLSAYTANLYIRRADGATLVRDCTIEENTISVSFPSNAYRVTGPAIALIRIAISKTQKISVSTLTFNVQRLETDTIVDPEDIIPDINDLLAEIDAMEQAAADCEAATRDAENYLGLLGGKMDKQGTFTRTDDVTIGAGRWNFSTNEPVTTFSETYCVYTIPSGTSILGFQGYNWNSTYKACGFYDAQTSELLYAPSFPDGTSIATTYRLSVPAGAVYFIVNLGSTANRRGVYVFNEITDFAPAVDVAVPKSSMFFGYSDFDQSAYSFAYKDVCSGGGDVYAATRYSSNYPYFLTKLKAAAAGSLQTGVTTSSRYDLTLTIDGVEKSLSQLRDCDDKALEISNMTYHAGYLYIAARGGSGAPSDLTKINSYLIVVNASTMQSVTWFGYHERCSTVRVDAEKNLLVTGDRGGGFTVYDISTPSAPSLIVQYNDAEILEYQHCSIYENSSGDTCLAFGCYTDGFAGFKLADGAIQQLFAWNNLRSYGANLNIFSVEVAYPYLYASVSPTNNPRKTGSKIMGVMTFDISDPANVTLCDWYQLPERQCGNWVTTVRSENGKFTLNGANDPAPNFVRINKGYLYISNEDAGIAAFGLSDPAKPAFVGNLPTGNWPRYFWIDDPIILTAGTYDYKRGEICSVNALTCILQ